MAYELHAADLEPLLLGGAFFGSGGGGTLVSARHLAAQFGTGGTYPIDTIRVVTVAEATEGDAVMVAYLGAPDAINRTTYPAGPIEAVRQVQARLAAQGRKLAYIAPPESGALGFIVAALVAARLGLSVIDGDGAGRAVPSLPMLTYAAAQVTPRPTLLVSENQLCVELNVTPRSGNDGCTIHQQDVSDIVEQMTRPIVAAPQFGQFGGLAMWIMSPEQLARAMTIRGTLSRALDTGRHLQRGQLRTAADMVAFLRSRFGLAARIISAPGHIVSAQADTAGGFDTGKVILKAGQTTYTVVYQNESLLAWDSNRPAPLATAPDSIAYFVEGDGQSVYSNGDLLLADGSLDPALAHRTAVLIAWEADAALRQPGGLILDSFRTLLADLGYLGPYVPVGAADTAGTAAVPPPPQPSALPAAVVSGDVA